MNKAIKKIGKFSSIFTGIGIIVVGLIIFGISAFAYFNHHELDGKVMATIVDIKKEKIEDVYVEDEELYPEQQYDYTVFVDYTVDGMEYKHVQYDSYSSSMKVGNTIEIQYDTKDPSKIQSTDGKTIINIFIVLGGLTVVFGIYSTIKGFKSEKENPMYGVMRD